jgi:hypothetical protein
MPFTPVFWQQRESADSYHSLGIEQIPKYPIVNRNS